MRWLRILDHAGVETVRFQRTSEGRHRLTGDVLALHEGQAMTVRYTLLADSHGRSVSLQLERTSGDAGRTLSLQRNPDGVWLGDGEPLPGLEDCDDIDLGMSPSTYMLPIRRMQAADRERMDVCAIRIRLPSLEVQRSAQRYTRLDARHWRHQHRDSGSSATLEVDEAGVVTDYDGIWQRLPAPGLAKNGFVDALLAAGPSPELGPHASDVDWLVGGWQAQVRDIDADGNVRESRGEWWFAWTLEGRVLQDVWISPPRGERHLDRGSAASDRYGTSLRRFERADGRWHVLWINPVSGVENRLQGGRTGRGIELHGHVDGKPILWSFEDIEQDRFVWRGRIQDAPGGPWRLQAEFRLQRIAAPSPAPDIVRLPLPAAVR